MKTLLALWLAAAAVPFHQAELIIPQEKWHNHASCIVELPNGDLLTVWYHGSGERQADDVIVEAARKIKGERTWRPRFLIADTPGFPDANPAIFLDVKQRLWLLWPVIVANEWHTALMKYKISSDYQNPSRPPRWETSDVLLIKPEIPDRPDKYFARMGWMTRAHPVTLPSGRIIVPLYSDGFSFSIMALSDDGGETWKASAPLVGKGNIQPSVVRKKDGTLAAYMRDNGPPPKRIHLSYSSDDGMTWSPPVDSDLPNPGSGCEVIRLSNGYWALAYNDTERGRNSLAVSLSDDEGKTWKWTRHLEKQETGQFHYPSIMQSRDGLLHVSYSYFTAEGQSIKHAVFNIEWVQNAQ